MLPLPIIIVLIVAYYLFHIMAFYLLYSAKSLLTSGNWEEPVRYADVSSRFFLITTSLLFNRYKKDWFLQVLGFNLECQFACKNMVLVICTCRP